MSSERPLDRLLGSVPRAGRLEWIGLAPARRAELVTVERVAVQPGTGLDGDHHARTGRGRRQVSFVQAEHLPVVGALLGRDAVAPADLRRNLIVSGINLLALKAARFRIGAVLFEGTGLCAPCSRMNETLGPGGFQATRGHGGIVAAALEAGEIQVGDPVEFVELVDRADRATNSSDD